MKFKLIHFADIKLFLIIILLSTIQILFSCDNFSGETETLDQIPPGYHGLWGDEGGDFLMSIYSNRIEIFERNYINEKQIRTPIKIEYMFLKDCKYCKDSYLKISFSPEEAVKWRPDFYNYQYGTDMVLFEEKSFIDPNGNYEEFTGYTTWMRSDFCD